MSNRMVIEPTEFVNIRDGSKTLGIRVYDDYEAIYDNTYDSIPDDNMELLKLVKDMGGKEIDAMLDHVIENEKGITIGGEYYDYDEIKEVLNVEV